MFNQPKVQILKSASKDLLGAVHSLKQQVVIDDIAGILFFCTSNYDSDILTHEINKNFHCQVVGCTTAGEITDTYSSNSIIALVFNAKYFALQAHLISNLNNFNIVEAMKIAGDIEKNLSFSQGFVTNKNFGFLLSDGLSLTEERVTALLYHAMAGINVLGGSVADDFKLEKTQVFYKKEFHQNSTVLVTIEIKESFGIFRLQHFEPTDKELITTDVDFDQRIVKEINGEPAALAYAKINGLDASNLSNIDFAMYPLMLKIADEWYIRSISKVGEDNSLHFHCAIDYGLPLRIGKGKDLVQILEDEVNEIVDSFEEIYFTLGCDCILRKIELISKNHTKKVEALLSKINFIGFNSYGEQFNGIHFNQTMIGVTVGKKK
jgi:hypothetical protein